LQGEGGAPSEILARAANEDSEVSRLNYILHVDVPQTQILHLQGDLDSHCLPGLYGDLLKALELDVRDYDTCHEILDVDLDDLSSVTLGVVGDLYRDCDRVRDGDSALGYGDRGVFECRVRFSVAELVERQWAVQDVLVTKDESAIIILLSSVDRTAGIQVVVIDGCGTHIIWEADGELSAGVGVSKEDVGGSFATFLRWLDCCTSADACSEIHASVIGFPDENTTTVGFPVSMMALTRWGMALTRLRLDTPHAH
jgi:hypothetical protein